MQEPIEVGEYGVLPGVQDELTGKRIPPLIGFKKELGLHDSDQCCYHVEGTKAILADREKELLELKGPCTSKGCRLHRAHSGPCHIV